MGLRFRRSIKVAPGVKINVSKGGISTSLGTQGASLNLGEKGIRTTIGAPGSGVSYSSYHKYGGSETGLGVSLEEKQLQKKAGYGLLVFLGVLITLGGGFLALVELPSGKYFAGLGIAFILFSIYITRGRNRMIEEQNKAIEEERKLAEAEKEQAIEDAYNVRVSIINERVEQNLLTAENRDTFLKHIANRTISIDNIDIELEKARMFYTRINSLTEKYGTEIADKLLAEEYWIGMTKEQVIDAKGREPDKVEIEALKTKTKEKLIYGNKTSGDIFEIENGLVARFKDR